MICCGIDLKNQTGLNMSVPPPPDYLVRPRGCGLKARAAAPADAEGVADGPTQAAPDSPGRLKKLYPVAQSEGGL